MINAEEHKQLLAQIKELEKNSVNYFDVEKEFFLITSDNLASVQTKFYGYSIQRTGIYEEDNLTPEAVANLDGRGCYVYVEVKDGKITIKQDLNGCWGIYLFRHGDYFALSNSFFRLLDYVKFRYPLTVNRDYCYQLIFNDLCSHVYSKTTINEIELVDRSAIIHISIANKNFEIELIDYKEHTISPDSKKGIEILDSWVDFWSDVLRGVSQHTKFIQADLSGGFDTRMSLIFLLHSGIDINKVQIRSADDNVGIHVEDYDIASKIATYYGFKLNQHLPQQRFLNWSISDIFNFDLYHIQTFHKDNTVGFPKKRVDKLYFLGGGSGETLRHYWHMPPEIFIKKQITKKKLYSIRLFDTLAYSVEKLIRSDFYNICKRYKINDKKSEDIPQYLYRETRARNHFGKSIIGSYLRNSIGFAPALDPDIRLLQIYSSQCSDRRLLMALLFMRYEPDLLKFPVEGGRSIAPETIEYAKKINERFPRQAKHVANITNRGGYFHLQPRDMQAEKILASGRNNKPIPNGLPEKCLKAMFDSSRTYGLFTAYFDEELYQYASFYYENTAVRRFRGIYPIVGVTRVLEDVEISQRNHRPYRDMQRFLEQDFCKINHEDSKIVSNFSRYFTARVDLKLMSTAGDFQILSTSDDKAKLEKPNWFQKDGVGYVIQSYVGELEILAKSTVDGKISMLLRGIDVRLPEDKTKLIPYWVDYTSLTVNGKKIFDTLIPVWHNKPYRYEIDAKAGEEIKIQVEWLPHRSDT